MSDGKFYLGQLRHAFLQAWNEAIGDQRSYADYLLGPAVKAAETAWEERDRYRAALEEIMSGWGCSCYPRPGRCPTCIARRALSGE